MYIKLVREDHYDSKGVLNWKLIILEKVLFWVIDICKCENLTKTDIINMKLISNINF